MMALKEILRTYEEASGQKVNYQKSSVFFGTGCDENAKNEAQQILQVGVEALNERYLGLPTVVGRSKEGYFKYTRERSSAKVIGWKGQGLSKAGREVLIKSVLQTTLTYAMSCFHFPKKLCRNMTFISS